MCSDLAGPNILYLAWLKQNSNDKHNKCDDEQYVNEIASYVKTKSEKPKNY